MQIMSPIENYQYDNYHASGYRATKAFQLGLIAVIVLTMLSSALLRARSSRFLVYWKNGDVQLSRAATLSGVACNGHTLHELSPGLRFRSMSQVVRSELAPANRTSPSKEQIGTRSVSGAKIASRNPQSEKEGQKRETPFNLTPEEHRLIDLQREVLRKVLSVVDGIDESCDRDAKLLSHEIDRLGDGFFLLVVAGEYNSGKSSLINALAGKRVLDEGPTPTTSQVTKLKYAVESVETQGADNDVLVLGEPIPILSNRLQIVDTPGTNAIERAHETLTRDYIPLCDLVLFVTSADRPFSESERLFLESIRQWG